MMKYKIHTYLALNTLRVSICFFLLTAKLSDPIKKWFVNIFIGLDLLKIENNDF